MDQRTNGQKEADEQIKVSFKVTSVKVSCGISSLARLLPEERWGRTKNCFRLEAAGVCPGLLGLQGVFLRNFDLAELQAAENIVRMVNKSSFCVLSPPSVHQHSPDP